MIGDVVYVTTKKNRMEYTADSADTKVFTEVLNTLDDPNDNFNINFKQYDNWEFQKSGIFYNHEYKPGVGDGKVNHIFIFNRYVSRSGVSAEKSLEYTNFVTNDGVIINSNCGSRVFGFRDSNVPKAVSGPAHEYCHYLYGGTQSTGHFDGFSYYNTSNRGRVYSFALMCAINAGWMSAYERYRLGWINPFVAESNTNSRILKDTHVENDAIIIPLRYAANGWLKEYYLIENYHTQRDYSGANPFLIDERFNEHFFTHGLLVFHIEDQDFDLPCATKINILCADGKWTWKLLTGSSTPSDRSDDLIGRDQPMRFGNFDERNYITINVGGINYPDYICLQPRPDFPGARYGSNDWLGDFEDFFRVGYNDVLTKFSNPGSYLIDGTAKDVGFEIVGYNSTTKEYTLSLQINSSGVLSLKPSKPQNLKVTINAQNKSVLTWEPNIEPDIITGGKYKIYMAETCSQQEEPWYELIATIDAYVNGVPVTTYTDYAASISTQCKLHYKITAFDNTNKESVASDPAWRYGQYRKVGVNVDHHISEYNLYCNYPNPFNPVTTINYDVKTKGFVSVSVFDVLGKEVANLVNENKEEGKFSVNFNAGDLPSGVYIYIIRVNDFVTSKKMTLLK